MKRPIILIVAVAATLVLLKVAIEDVLGLQIDRSLQSWLTNAGIESALLIVGLLVIDVVLPVPSSLVMVLSGAAFGVWRGALLALTGSVAGGWLAFEIVRRFGRSAARRFVAEDELERLSRTLDTHGATIVVATRAVPVVMETMSLVAGLSRMPRRTFLLASVAGTLPIVVIYAWAGAMSRDAGTIVPAVVILLAVAASGWLLFRTRISPRSTSSSEASRD